MSLIADTMISINYETLIVTNKGENTMSKKISNIYIDEGGDGALPVIFVSIPPGYAYESALLTGELADAGRRKEGDQNGIRLEELMCFM